MIARVTSRLIPATGARGVLDDAGGVRAMTWIIAIMLFLTVLAAALGITTRNAAAGLDRQLAGRLTVQIAGDDAAATRIEAALAGDAGVRRARRIPPAEIARLVAPWLGEAASDPDLPMPALVDVDLRDGAAADRVTAKIRSLSPRARVDRQADVMAPVAGLLSAITWLAIALVLLMAGATAAVVVLAARAGLDAHRPTIEVMHMLGSTDVQVARLFQRRIARDALAGGAIGGVAALAVVALLGLQVAGLGSELLGGAALGTGGWVILVALPFVFVGLAALAARLAIVAALERIL